MSSYKIDFFEISKQIEILNIISIIGTYGFNIFCISLFTSPSIFILSENRKDIIVCFVLIISTISFYILGSQNIEKYKTEQTKDLDFKIRAISSNIMNNSKTTLLINL